MGAVIDGLQLTYANDDELLAQGMTLFEALYRAFDQSAPPRRPAHRRPPRGEEEERCTSPAARVDVREG